MSAPPQAVPWIARSLFRAWSARLVLAVHLPKSRSNTHLDTVITMYDLPELMAKALGVSKIRVVETGGDAFEAEREQWDDGNNVGSGRAGRGGAGAAGRPGTRGRGGEPRPGRAELPLQDRDLVAQHQDLGVLV